MSSIGKAAAGGGGVTAIYGALPITVVGPPATPTIGVNCASEAAAGVLERATQNETFTGAVLGGSGCPLAVNPSKLIIRQENPGANYALFSAFTNGPGAAAARGVSAVDLQTVRAGGYEIASGNYSVALGSGNTASFANATAIGRNNSASGSVAGETTAIGSGNTASEDKATAVGVNNYATAENSTAIGSGNTASGGLSPALALGFSNSATGYGAAAIGGNNYATGINSVALGESNTAGGSYTMALGYGNSIPVGADNASLFGRSNFVLATSVSAVAFGVMNNVLTPGNLNNATGVIAGDPQGAAAAIGINSTAIGVGNQATGLRAVAVGFKNVAGNNYGAVAVGITCTASGINSTAIGRSCVANNYSAVAVGGSCTASGTSSTAVGVGSSATGASASAIGGGCTASGNYAFAAGTLSTASGNYSVAIGQSAVASASMSAALGYGAQARITKTTNISGPVIIRKDNGEADADIFQQLSGTPVVIMWDEIDLTVVADKALSLPAGAHIWINEVGIICTDVTGLLTTQPTIRFGITGTPAKWLAATVTTLLTAALKRERYTTLLTDDGETSLSFGVTSAAVVGTSMSGRPYAIGILVED